MSEKKKEDEDEAPLRSALRKQPEAKFASAPEYSFYGPVGQFKDGKLSKNPKTKTTEPGPDKYVSVNFKINSTYSYSQPIAFPGRSNWNERQVHRLNMHRARQIDWPSCGDFNTVTTEERLCRERTQLCRWTASTVHRPFHEPLPGSAKDTLNKRTAKRAATTGGGGGGESPLDTARSGD